jgi:hypothetical protein
VWDYDKDKTRPPVLISRASSRVECFVCAGLTARTYFFPSRNSRLRGCLEQAGDCGARTKDANVCQPTLDGEYPVRASVDRQGQSSTREYSPDGKRGRYVLCKGRLTKQGGEACCFGEILDTAGDIWRSRLDISRHKSPRASASGAARSPDEPHGIDPVVAWWRSLLSVLGRGNLRRWA